MAIFRDIFFWFLSTHSYSHGLSHVDSTQMAQAWIQDGFPLTTGVWDLLHRAASTTNALVQRAFAQDWLKSSACFWPARIKAYRLLLTHGKTRWLEFFGLSSNPLHRVGRFFFLISFRPGKSLPDIPRSKPPTSTPDSSSSLILRRVLSSLLKSLLARCQIDQQLEFLRGNSESRGDASHFCRSDWTRPYIEPNLAAWNAWTPTRHTTAIHA